MTKLTCVKPGKNAIFLKKKKWQNGNAIVVQVENLKNFRSQMTKQTSLLESSHEI